MNSNEFSSDSAQHVNPPASEATRPLTTTQAAELLGVTGRTVQTLVRQGVIPARTLRPGGRRPAYRIDRADLLAYVARQAVQPTVDTQS